jgi:hypothetical protein
MSRQTPSPATLPVGDALDRSESLSGLLRRVHESNARYAAVRPRLPAGLAAMIRPGPLDDTSWTLLVPSGAAAAKLRQCLPAVVDSLRSSGWSEVDIRVKVLAGSSTVTR